MSPPSVQARIDLVAIEGGVARFGTHKSSHAVAVLDLFAAENSLANADEATQEEVLAGRAQFLNAQTHRSRSLFARSRSISMGTCAAYRPGHPCSPKRWRR